MLRNCNAYWHSISRMTADILSIIHAFQPRHDLPYHVTKLLRNIAVLYAYHCLAIPVIRYLNIIHVAHRALYAFRHIRTTHQNNMFRSPEAQHTCKEFHSLGRDTHPTRYKCHYNARKKTLHYLHTHPDKLPDLKDQEHKMQLPPKL